MFESGNFKIGCNYWASHAGVFMWQDWRPEVVERDFELLRKINLSVVRIFPLWSDFQPLRRFAGGYNNAYQLRWKDGGHLPFDVDGRQSGVDPEMLERFRFVCDCAERYRLKVGIGLVTGWMSGRLFAPPAFEQSDLLRDPLVINWQLRFVCRFVSEFHRHPAIAFWGIGNECNNLEAVDRHEGAMWSRIIADAIRSIDQEHPVLAGMHGLTPQPVSVMKAGASWSIQDMAEIFDVLTVHPYPLFSRFTAVDRLMGIKNAFHATAEAHFYSDIGKRPCVAEEIGTLAPTIANETTVAEYIRGTLWNLWSHDCQGLWWWCGFDQDQLKDPPYEWCAVERQLGLFRNDGSCKPVARELSRFEQIRTSLPFERLPRFHTEAVCLLNEDQDCWMAAFGAWMLAKQAGFDLEFQFTDEPLRPAELYILPAQCGLNNVPRNRFRELMAKVSGGATLYYSFDGACLAPFDEYFGITSCGFEVYAGKTQVAVEGSELEFNFQARITLGSAGAEILLRDSDGLPMFTVNRFGKGKVFFAAYSPEKQIVNANRAVERSYWKFYRTAAEQVLEKRIFRSGAPLVTATVHPVSGSSAYAVAVNNGENPVSLSPVLAASWKISELLYGECGNIPAHDAVILKLEQNV